MATSKKAKKEEIIPSAISEGSTPETPISEEMKIENDAAAEEPPKEIIPEPVKEVKAAPPRPEIDPKLPKEERIVAFLKSRGSSEFVKLNDFLKSLYPAYRMNEMPQWMVPGESKTLGGLLGRMSKDGKIVLNGDHYKRLGRPYYADGRPETQHYHIGTIVIEAKLP